MGARSTSAPVTTATTPAIDQGASTSTPAMVACTTVAT